MTIPNLSVLAVRERAVTLFLIISIACAGVYSYLRLGRAEDPQFTVKVLTITMLWPGAAAGGIQRQAGDRVEKRLQELTWYDHVETVARPGLIQMKLRLQDSTPPGSVQEEFYHARKKVRDEAINLPRGVIGPIVNDEFSDSFFSMIALSAPSLPHRQLVLQAEEIREHLLKVAGVLKVNIIGEQAQQIFVEISTRRLATLGITGPMLFDAIARQNDLTPSGFVETEGTPRIYRRPDNAIDSLDQLRAIPIEVGGRTVKIGDIAEVHRGDADPPLSLVRQDGQTVLMFGIVMKPRFNGLELGRSLQRELGALRHQLPLGLQLVEVSDQAKVIGEAFDEFMAKFFTALAVVMVVSLVSLGLRVGIVVAAAVPLTLSAVFLIMLVTGRDFDRVTLGALIISLGLLVDDAIIAIEMMVVKDGGGARPRCRRRLRLGRDRGADADRHPGDDRGLPAGRLLAIDLGRICRQHVLGRFRAHYLPGRRGDVHAVSRRQACCRTSPRWRAATTPFTLPRRAGVSAPSCGRVSTTSGPYSR